MHYIFHALIFTGVFLRVNGGLRFDRYSGKKVELAEDNGIRLKNASEKCTIEVKPCAPHDGSRIDGTCNNYKYPSKGAAKGPYLRLLNPDYGKDKKDIRKNKNGTALPSARLVRTTLQTTGRVDDKHSFTIAVPHYFEFIKRDVSILNGPQDYLRKRQYCCQPEGRADPRCKPISVPDDDPYLKVTDIRCLNFSRAETFQDAGCTSETKFPEQINFQTPHLDLSTVYGVDEKALQSVRVYKHGLLKLERRGERYVPLNISSPIANVTDLANNATVTLMLPDEVSMLTMEAQNLTSTDICYQNKRNESKTICYKFGFPEVGNYDLRTTTLTIFFMREHNRLARELYHMNPCWKDDRLFKVARQINIATAANIFLYEMLPLILGVENMVHYNLISNRVEQLSAYYKDEVPLVYTEYEIAARYFHTLFDGRVKEYDEHYHLLGQFPFSDVLYRQELLEINKNFEKINRGTFFQHAAKADDIQDPEISEKFFGGLQRAHDLSAIDIQRGRDLGVRGYNDYRHLCGMKPAKRFEEFSDVMDTEKILALKKLYNDTDEVDLLAGIVSENHIKGAIVGPTLFCIIAKQLLLWRFSDRFWFERGDQLRSFNLGQLHEIRRTNIARLACDNAEAIKQIQPRAFLHADFGNPEVPCSQILGPNLRKWEDKSCRKPEKEHGDIIRGEGKRLPETDYGYHKTNEAGKKMYEGKDYGYHVTHSVDGKHHANSFAWSFHGTEDKKPELVKNSNTVMQDPTNMIRDYSTFFEQLLSSNKPNS